MRTLLILLLFATATTAQVADHAEIRDGYYDATEGVWGMEAKWQIPSDPDPALGGAVTTLMYFQREELVTYTFGWITWSQVEWVTKSSAAEPGNSSGGLWIDVGTPETEDPAFLVATYRILFFGYNAATGLYELKETSNELFIDPPTPCALPDEEVSIASASRTASGSQHVVTAVVHYDADGADPTTVSLHMMTYLNWGWAQGWFPIDEVDMHNNLDDLGSETLSGLTGQASGDPVHVAAKMNDMWSDVYAIGGGDPGPINGSGDDILD